MGGYENSLMVNKQRDTTLRIVDNKHTEWVEVNLFFVFAGVGNFALAVLWPFRPLGYPGIRHHL